MKVNLPPEHCRSRQTTGITLSLTRTAGTVILALNGVDIYSYPCGDAALPFGLFHYKDRTDVKVRNPELSGDWPESVPEDLFADLAAPSEAPASAAEGRALNQLIGEKFFAERAYEVYQRSLDLPADERFEYLSEWVLPGPTHAWFRTYAATTPTNPAAPIAIRNRVDAQQLSDAQSAGQNRVLLGGGLVSPAQELIDVAAELDRLDELYREIESLTATNPHLVRSRVALLAMIALAQERPEARQQLADRTLLRSPSGTRSATVHRRWVDLIAAQRAVLHPATRDIAIELVDLIVTTQIQNGSPGSGQFDSHARAIRGLGWALRDRDSQSNIIRIDAVDAPSATGPVALKAMDTPPARWSARPGALDHLAGHESDSVYFDVPLQGNYEINARLSSFGWREIEVTAAGLYTAPLHPLDLYRIGHARHRRADARLEQPLAPIRAWYDCRIVVQDGVYTSYVNGHLLHSETLPENPDPWIDVHSAAHLVGGVRRLLITGDPAVPEEIDLLTHSDLSNWITDFYRVPRQGDDADWRMESGTLIGRRRPQLAGTHVESVIRYHRPLLEDGQIEYQFVYQPGTTHVHPALGRLALLIEEAGVSEHWLTCAEHDRSELASDNVAIHPEYRRGPETLPLINGDWNQVRLDVAGDQLRLSLNGELVYERPIDDGHQRFFGLFHEIGETEVRVRKMIHRGEWPRDFPSPENQELAAVAEELSWQNELGESLSVDFDSSEFTAGDWLILNDPGQEYIRPTEDGLRMTFPAGEEKPSVVGLGPRFGLRGDFDVIAAFQALSIAPPSEAWGAGIEINVTFADATESRVQFERRASPDGKQSLTAARYARFPDGDEKYRSDTDFLDPASGVLRVSRRGGTISFSFAESIDQPFRLHSQQYVGTTDVRNETIRVVSSDASGGADVIWTSLIVRADEFLHETPSQPSQMTEWSPDLASTPIGGPLLKVPQPGGQNFVFRTADGIRMRTPGRQDSPFGVSIVPHRLRVEGDFEITAEFELSQLTAPETGYGAGVELVLFLDDDQQRKLYLCRRAYPDRPQGVAVHHVWHEADVRQDNYELLLTAATAGTLRLSRRGETVTWLFSPDGEEEYYTIAEQSAGTAAVRQIALQCGSGSPTSGRVNVLWKKLTVRGDSITQ